MHKREFCKGLCAYGWLGAYGFMQSAAATSTSSQALKVVTSFTILQDLAKQIGQDDAEVQSLMGVGIDPHDFQPSPTAVRRLAKADLFISNGHGLEGWVPRLLKSTGFKGLSISCTEGWSLLPSSVGISKVGGHTHGASNLDPHAWHDPRASIHYTARIADAMARLRPGLQTAFRERHRAFEKNALSLDARIKQELAEVPVHRKRVLCTHPGFAYLGKAYGIEFVSPPAGMIGASQWSAAQMARWVDWGRTQKVSAVFGEQGSDMRAVTAAARELKLPIGGMLYSDSLSEPGGPADTWLKMMSHNTQLLIRAVTIRS